MHSVIHTGGSDKEAAKGHRIRDKKKTVGDSRRLFSRKRKFMAGFLAAVCPGLGHIYLGLYRKGIAFIFTLLLDASALLYFSSIGMQINVPLLILLALVIPVTYFYNVYDVLQSADYILHRVRISGQEVRETSPYRNPFTVERSSFFGIMLIAGGALMFLFYQKPRWLKIYMEDYGKIMVAALLVAAGLWAGCREIWILRKQCGSQKPDREKSGQ